MKLNEERLAFVRENRHMEPKKLAKVLGVSVRHVERALREIGDADAIGRARARRKALAAGVLVALGAACWLGLRWRSSVLQGDAEAAARARTLAAKKTAADIYQALDGQQAGRSAEIAAHLSHTDEEVRLASVRYLLKHGERSFWPQALALVDDMSERVRLATVQLMSELADPSLDPSIEARLVRVAENGARSVGERALALNLLRKRPAFDVGEASGELLSVLRDSNATVREMAHAVLLTAFPKSGVALSNDSQRLHDDWARALASKEYGGGRPAATSGFDALVLTLEIARRDAPSVRSMRQRCWTVHDIARLRTPQARAFVLALAKNEGADEVERCAAVAALARASDADALREIAACTSNTLVQAKLVAVRNH